MLSVFLTIVSAALTHMGARAAGSVLRPLGLLSALILLSIAFYLSEIPGGFWSGVYTLLSLYFLSCLVTPWAYLAWISRRVS